LAVNFEVVGRATLSVDREVRPHGVYKAIDMRRHHSECHQRATLSNPPSQQLRPTALDLNRLSRSSRPWSAIAGRRPAARGNDYMYHLVVPSFPPL
jgi:hypothetical protein